MPVITLKIPRKLDRVEIIRGDDYFFDDEPVETIEEEFDPSEFVVEEEIPEPVPTVIVQEFTVPLDRAPVAVVIPQIPPETMELEEVKKEVQNAYDKGYADGTEVTKNVYLDEIDALRDRLAAFGTMSESLRKQFFDDIKNMEHAVLTLGIMIAEQILGYECERDNHPFIAQVKKALRSAGEDTIFAVRMHPDNIGVFETIKSPLAGSITDLDHVRLIKDYSLDKMSCVLMTSTGIIDASLPVQLEQIRKTLEPVREKSTLEEESFFENIIRESDPEIQ